MIIIGEEERDSKTAQYKDMLNRTQEIIPSDKLVEIIINDFDVNELQRVWF